MIDGMGYGEKCYLIIRLMNYIYVVDMIFWVNLCGRLYGYIVLNIFEMLIVDELEMVMIVCMDEYI